MSIIINLTEHLVLQLLLSNGYSSEERFLSFVNTNLNDFNIPQDIVLSRKTENDKYINLDFTQYYNNLEIIDSRLYAKLTLDNKLVAFGLDVFSDISLDVIPTISESMAIESASENIISSITKKSVEDNLKILPIPFNGKYDFHLVYVVRVSTQLTHGPANYICYVDANNGELINENEYSFIRSSSSS
jgi:Zn-dependent metalloprotease